MNQHLSKTALSRPFTNFYKLAENYCNFIESSEKISAEAFLVSIQKHLVELYSSGLKLEDVDLTSVINYERAYTNSEIINLISEKLDAQFYWHIFDPSDLNDTEAVCGDLIDDLNDIYLDLKSSIELFNPERDECRENALWQFKFDFDNHWNSHCINAIYAIHYFLKR
ncbi:MAG: DUF5063 domain-containing protein [Pedobacter sp.]|nr:MAG: DUF5063 domain-containing protein [Pedobacter sp.]